MGFSRLAVVAGLALALAPAAAAQEIEGELIEEGTGAPIAGAFVVLLDASGRQVDVALSDARGRFGLAAPVPGRYALGLDRIGYLSTVTEPIPLAAGQRVIYRLTTIVQPVELDDIDVTVERECEVQPAEGEDVSRVWEEARKALNATAFTQQMGLLEYAVLARERQLDPRSLEVRREATRRRSGVSRGSPYVALPVEVLARQGFVAVAGDTVAYYGPDPTTLLSEWFAESHCFRFEPSREMPGWIGLAFRPVGGRRQADIQGTLWIDGATAELHRLDYAYTGLPSAASGATATGRIEFERLDSGEWMIRRWWIRMPVVQRADPSVYSHLTMDPGRRVDRVVALKEDSGEVTEVVSRRSSAPGREAPAAGQRAPGAGEPAPPRRRTSEPIPLALDDAGGAACVLDAARIAGTVRDARTGVPLPGARVTATWGGEGSGATRSDPLGRYALCDVPAGVAVVVRGSFPGREGERLVVPPPAGARGIDLALRGKARVEAPAVASVVEVAQRPPGPGAAELAVSVRDDASGAPLPGAQVSLSVGAMGGAADAGGRLRLAGVPAGTHRLVVEHLGYVTAETEIAVELGGRLAVSVRLVPQPIAVAALDVVIPSEAELQARGTGEARYVLRDEDIPDSAGLTVGDVIKRLVPGARYRPDPCPVILTRSGPIGLVVIDHQTFHDTCVLNMVEPEDIETLEFLPSIAGAIRYGVPGGGGVIVITTKHGRDEEE